MPTSRPSPAVHFGLRSPSGHALGGNAALRAVKASRAIHDVYAQLRHILTHAMVGKIEQDHLRRIVLREHDSSHNDPVAPTFITTTARTALDLGYHVILEGILHTGRYAQVLHQLIEHHPGPVAVFYIDVSLNETVRRHLSRAEPISVTADQMREWYTHRDLLDLARETMIPETSSLAQTVATILHTSGLARTAALTPCLRRCRHCARRVCQENGSGAETVAEVIGLREQDSLS